MNLHDELTSLAQAAGSYADAGDAIGRIKTQNRRRVVVATVAALVALALLPMTAWGIGDTDSAPPADISTQVQVAMLLGNDQVRFSDGKEVTLPEPATGNDDLFMTPNGLLFNGTTGLYLIDEDGKTRSMGGSVAEIRISADGGWGAWLAGPQDVVLARLDGPTPEPSTATDTGGSFYPLAVVGSMVIMGERAADGTATQRWDVWDSTQGTFIPKWRDEPYLDRVLGLQPDGSGALMTFTVDTKGNCLSMLYPAQNDILPLTCDLGPSFDGGSILSPSGNAAYDVEGGTFINIKDMLNDDTGLQIFPDCPEGEDAVWIDDQTVAIITGDGTLATCTYPRRDESEATINTFPDVNATALIPGFGI